MSQPECLPELLPVEGAIGYLRALGRLMTQDAEIADTLLERALETALCTGALQDPDCISLPGIYRILREFLQETPPGHAETEYSLIPSMGACLPYTLREALLIQAGAGISVQELSALLNSTVEIIEARSREARSRLCAPCHTRLFPPHAA